MELLTNWQAAAMGLIIAALVESKQVLEISKAFGELLGAGDELNAYRLTRFPVDSYPFSISDWMSFLKREADNEDFKKATQKPAVVLARRDRFEGFTQLLANELGVNVSAPSAILTHQSGYGWSLKANTGQTDVEWRYFRPKK